MWCVINAVFWYVVWYKCSLLVCCYVNALFWYVVWYICCLLVCCVIYMLSSGMWCDINVVFWDAVLCKCSLLVCGKIYMVSSGMWFDINAVFWYVVWYKCANVSDWPVDFICSWYVFIFSEDTGYRAFVNGRKFVSHRVLLTSENAVFLYIS